MNKLYPKNPQRTRNLVFGIGAVAGFITGLWWGLPWVYVALATVLGGVFPLGMACSLHGDFRHPPE